MIKKQAVTMQPENHHWIPDDHRFKTSQKLINAAFKNYYNFLIRDNVGGHTRENNKTLNFLHINVGEYMLSTI